MMPQKPMLGVVAAAGPPAPTTPTPPQEAPQIPPAPTTPTPPPAAPNAPPLASATPPQAPPGVPPPASATPPQAPPGVPPPASATPPQAAPDVPPPEPATPPKEFAGLPPAEPPPPPPAKVVAGLGPQAPPPKGVATCRPSEGLPVKSFSGSAQRVPVSEPVQREYLTAVKIYEQQVGPNTVRAKMIVESLPTAPSGMPAERRYSPLPGTGYGPDIDMGPGTDYIYAPMLSGHGYQVDGGAPPNVQRSREDFRNLALGNDVNLAKMAEMGPKVRRLLDMGSHIDQILDITNMPPAGRRPSGYAEPTGPTMVDSYGRPPPPGYGAPMGRRSAEQDPRIGGRPSYEGPNYARRPCSRERTAYVGENRPASRSMSRDSDRFDRIQQDIDEQRAENMLEKIRADIASTDYSEPDVRVRPRRYSLQHDSRPPSRNVRRASYDDDGRSDRRAPSKPRRQRSRHLKKSSSSSSSSSSVDRPRSGRTKRSKESKGKKSRRNSKKSSSSSSSSSSGSRSKPKPKGRSIEYVRKVTERLSSSSTGSNMELNDPPQRQYSKSSDMPPPPQQCLQRVSSSNTHAQPVVHPASPNRAMSRSAEKGIMRTQAKTAAGTLFKNGVKKEPTEDEEEPQGPQVASSGGAVYRYESYPPAHPH